MNFKELAAKRYSCRKISDKKVDPQLIDQIIEAGILAPTACNNQPYKIFLMDSDKAKETVKKVTSFTFGADVFLAVGYKKEEAWTRKFDGENFGAVDAAIVATHMMMEIEDLGLAATWVGYFDAPLLKELCPEMQDYEMIAIFPVGYAAEDAEISPKHTSRKSKEEALEIL